MAGALRATKRRLAAILALDVVGSSRLMEADEPGTLSAIEEILTQHLTPAADRHDGRVVKTLGDGALVEFASPVEAVLCAIEVQAGAADSALKLRIGINLGDIVATEDGDVHGDTVNVAVRLESIADPGGICVSGKVFDELEGKVVLPFQERGEQRLKNIARSVRVYVIPTGALTAKEPESARPAAPTADRPSIAVLPFTNLSGDPEQEYLGEGIADDILTALAQSRWLFVMARSSSFAFRGSPIETDQVARRLGVRYVLTGSVRRSGDHMRISIQLTDAETGGSLWAERYDRAVVDVLKLQDEIAEAVAGAIEPELLKVESRRAVERPQSLAAWDLVRRGMWEFHRISSDGHHRARDLFLQAIQADPTSADGYIWLARAEAGLLAYGWTADPTTTASASMKAALDAAQLDPKNPYAHYAVAISHTMAGESEVAIRAAERCVSLSPTFALGHLVLGFAKLSAGAAKQAVEPLEHGLRLSPFDPQNFTWLLFLAVAYAFSGEPGRGLDSIRRSLSLRPGWPPAVLVEAFCLTRLGEHERARRAAGGLDVGVVTTQPIMARLPPTWTDEISAAFREDAGAGKEPS